MISYYQAPFSQRGYGFGGIFRGLSKIISPLAGGVRKIIENPTVRGLAKDAVKTGVSMAADFIEGKDVNAKGRSEKLLKKARKRISRTVREYGDSESNNNSEDSDVEEEEKPLRKKIRTNKAKRRKTIFDERF